MLHDEAFNAGELVFLGGHDDHIHVFTDNLRGKEFFAGVRFIKI
jgi:hypothetical protein